MLSTSHNFFVDTKKSLSLVNPSEVSTWSLWPAILHVLQFWEDFYLSWDPIKYGNITRVNIPVDAIWTPPVGLLNSWVSHCYEVYGCIAGIWLLWVHLTSSNETVSSQNLWAGNVAKSMTSEGNSALLPAIVNRRPPSQWGLINFQLYNKTLQDWSLGKQLILFPLADSRETKLFPSGPVMKCLVLGVSNMSIFNQECWVNITPLAESPFVFLLIEEKKRRLCPNRVEPLK